MAAGTLDVWSYMLGIIVTKTDVSLIKDDRILPITFYDTFDQLKEWDGKLEPKIPSVTDIGIDRFKNIYRYATGKRWLPIEIQ